MTRNKHVKIHFDTETSVGVGNLNTFLLTWSKSRVITVLHSQLYYHSHYKRFYTKTVLEKLHNKVTTNSAVHQQTKFKRFSNSYRLKKSLKENYTKSIPIKYAILERHSGLFSSQTHV